MHAIKRSSRKEKRGEKKYLDETREGGVVYIEREGIGLEKE